jgi:putative addiction module component (TIGR02574 family)
MLPIQWHGESISSMKLVDLPLKERLKLVEDLWDSIAAEEQNVVLTEAQRRLLDERLDAYELDGDLGEPAETVVDRIRRAL